MHAKDVCSAAAAALLLSSAGARANNFHEYPIGAAPTGAELGGPWLQGTNDVTFSLGQIVGQTPVLVGSDLLAQPLPTIVARAGVYPDDFVQPGDNGNWTLAINRAVAAAKASGLKLKFAAHVYSLATPWFLDLAGIDTKGFTIEGQGSQLSVLSCTTAISSGPCVQVYDDSTSGAAFYDTIRDLGFAASTTGATLQLGLESFSDALNQLRLDDVVANNNLAGSSGNAAIEENGVYSATETNVVANDAGQSTNNGDALRLRQVQFSFITGSVGNAGIGVHLTGGYDYGNTLGPLDMEVDTYPTVQDSANSERNTFVGGTVATTTYGAKATAGGALLLENTNISTPSSGSFLVPGSVPIIVHSADQTFCATPAVPASGTALVNACEQTGEVALIGGTVSGVTVNGAAVSTSSFILNPGDSMVITYTSTPGMTIRPVR